MRFLFLLDYGTEVVFDIDGSQYLFDIQGINHMSEKFVDDPDIMVELEQARIALFNFQTRPELETLT